MVVVAGVLVLPRGALDRLVLGARFVLVRAVLGLLARFVSVAPYTRLDRESGGWRTAFSFVTDHEPGALHLAIEPFGRHRLDLVQLVSRPIPATPWRYRFDAVLAGHPLDPIVTETLAEVQGLTRELRVFGSYPAHS